MIQSYGKKKTSASKCILYLCKSCKYFILCTWWWNIYLFIYYMFKYYIFFSTILFGLFGYRLSKCL